MTDRREFLLGSVAAGIATVAACTRKPVTASTRAALESAVGARRSVAGIVAVVVDNGATNLVTYGSSGVPDLALDADTVFEIGSITKVLTALLLSDMAARGEVAFDDPVAKYLPASVTLHERGGPITLLDLASYTSGLPNMPDNITPGWWSNPNPFADYTVDKLNEFLSSYQPAYEPGTQYEYANLGFALLAVALARRAGKSYEELLIERVCDPLGLGHTRIALSDEMRKHLAQGHDLNLNATQLWDLAALQGAGAVRSNARDLTAFLEACMGIAQTALRAAFARLLATRRPTRVVGTDAALGWFVSVARDEEIVWKSGLTGGFNTFAGFSTRRRRGALVLTNFLWQPIDVGTIEMSLRLIAPDFRPGNLELLYRPA